jgi:carbonic anhydrase
MNRKMGVAIAVVASWVTCGVAGTAQQHNGPPHFSYSGDTGPGYWWETNPGCAPSPRESPIDIDHAVVDPRLGPLDLKTTEAPFRLGNTGYTLQATPAAESGTLTIAGQAFTLAEFHFHTLSEHTVSGRRGVMELHVVFQQSPENLAVIGVLYKIGRPDAFLQTLIRAGLPQKRTSPPAAIPRLNLAQAFTDLASYHTYLGSLTTPPCSETVTWFVLKQWAEMSPEQYEAFRNILGNDFRPIQKTAGRMVRATAR